MIADALLSCLDGVRRTGADRWLARCPAHDEKRRMGPHSSLGRSYLGRNERAKTPPRAFYVVYRSSRSER